MKKLLSLLFMVGLAAAIVSCSEDDGGEGTTDTVTVNTCVGVECYTIVVSSNISENTTWSSDTIYELGGRIAVESGVTLEIEPGTIIKGAAGTGTNATALLVARGATLDAQGTADAPIIFTSVADQIDLGETVSPNMDETINGLWGGVIILGNAGISASNDDGDISETQIEGIPEGDANGLYGGSADDDNSGTISYISIRHGGSNIGSGNEINGLTLGGIGSATSIIGVEVVANQDDGIEWFGGAVDMSNVLVWNVFDDGLDTDQDWTGTCSDYIVVTPQGGSAFELDGPEGSESTQKGENHTFSNGIVYAGGAIDHIVDWDGSTNAVITDLYIFGVAEDYGQSGSAIESFEGSATGLSSGWEYTLAEDVAQAGDEDDPEITPATAAELLGDALDISTEVADPSAASKGPDAADFAWTWAGESGALTSLGL